MRSVLAAALLAVTSVAASAQAMHSGISHLVASVDAPAFGFQASAITAAKPRVFSGIVAPIRLTEVKLAASLTPARVSDVTVQYTVDEAGVPQNVKILSSVDEATSARVADAVSKLKYKPGTLDGQPMAIPVTLHVALR